MVARWSAAAVSPSIVHAGKKGELKAKPKRDIPWLVNKKSTKKRETSFALILMVTKTFCQLRVSPTVSAPPAIPLLLVPGRFFSVNSTRWRRTNQRGRTRCHATSGTISNALYLGATGRYGLRIKRSPSRNQRESSNAKFHCQWQKRVCCLLFWFIDMHVFYSINHQTHNIQPTTGKPPASHRQTNLSRSRNSFYRTVFVFVYQPFRFSFLPCPKQANQRVGQCQQLHESWSKPTIARKDAQTSRCVNSFPLLPRPLPVRTTPSSAKDGKIFLR